MKKILLTSGIALLALATIVGAQSYVFNTNLTVGSTGADVVALQTWLIAQGYSIPAISSGAAAPGYFGSQTKAAVAAYQVKVGLPSFGFFGPLTRVILNGGTTVAAGCPTGFICTPVNVVAVACPTGFICTPMAGTVVNNTTNNYTSGTPLVMDGTDGSLTVSLSSYAGNITIQKGETKDMVAVKAQATAAPVSITRFDVRMSQKPWLYFSKITLKDSTGTVIATKNISSIADVTEITVASDYLIRFEGINYTVTPGADKILVVSGTVLTATDKLTSDVSVIVSVPTASIRTINGKGYTDSLGIGAVGIASGRTITLSGTNSVGNIVVRVSPSTPAQRIVTTSTSGETKDVILGVFDFKSENTSSRLNTLTFSLKDDAKSTTPAWATILKNLRLVAPDGTQYTVDSVASSSVFSNLNIAIARDVWTSLTLKGDVADQDLFTNGMLASTTITTVTLTNPVGSDANDNAVTATVSTVSSNDITFLKNGASITSMSASTPVNVDNGSSAVVKKIIGFTFTFNNTGTNDLYVAKDANIALGTTTSFAATSTKPWTTTVVSPSAISGDTATMYMIPSGSSRVFANSSTVDMTRDNSVTTGGLKISAIYFTDLTNIAVARTYSITFGLEALQTPLMAF